MHKLWPLWLASSLLSCLFIGTYYFELIINLSNSMPVGVYQRTSEPLQYQSFVTVCLPPNWASLALEREYIQPGICPETGAQPLLKYLVALPGDSVFVEAEVGIFVNGQCQLGSILATKDSKNRPIKATLQTGLVPLGQALVLAPTPGSFDGRYFGLVPLSSLQPVQPLLIF